MGEGLRGWARRWLAERAGSIPVMFALAIIPVMSLAGAGIDMANAVKQRTQLQAASDTAALVAAKTFADSKTPTLEARVDEAETAARAFFNANMPDQSGISALTLSVVPIDGGFRVVASGGVNTSMLKVAGIEKIDVSVVSEALSALGRAYFYFVIDTSPSMTLPSEEGVFAPVTSSGCFFTCHDDGSLTRAEGLVPKMDIVRDMLIQLIEEVKGSISEFHKGIYFSVKLFDTATRDPIKLENDVTKVEDYLEDPLVLGGSGTNLIKALESVAKDIENVKKKVSNSSQDRHIVIFITDGVHERMSKDFEQSGCDKVKAQKAELYTVHVKNGEWAYDNPNARPRITLSMDIIRFGGYDPRGLGYMSGLVPAEDHMRTCASKASMAYRGEFGDELRTAFEQLTNDIVNNNLRLTF